MSRDELARLFANQNVDAVNAALEQAMHTLGLVGDELPREDALRVLAAVAGGEGSIAIGARFASARVLLQPTHGARRGR